MRIQALVMGLLIPLSLSFTPSGALTPQEAPHSIYFKPSSSTAENIKYLDQQARSYFASITGVQREAELKEAFEQLGIDSSKIKTLGESYAIRFPVEGNSRCRGVLNGHFTKVTSQADVDALSDQIFEVGLFLKRYHQLMRGQEFALFQIKIVEIWNRHALGRDMEYSGGVLRIGVGSGLTAYHPIGALKLLELWNKGDFFEVESQTILASLYRKATGERPSLDSYLAKGWAYMNPIGRLRVGLRALLMTYLENGVGPLEKLREELGTKGEEDTRNLIFRRIRSVISSHEFKEELGAHYEPLLSSLHKEQLREVLDKWIAKMQSTQFAAQVLEAVAQPARDERRYVNEQEPGSFGIAINVQNDHHIDAVLSVGRGRFQRLLKSAAHREIVKENKQKGLINVSTHDTVQAHLQIALENSAVEKLALLEVFEELGYVAR